MAVAVVAAAAVVAASVWVIFASGDEGALMCHHQLGSRMSHDQFHLFARSSGDCKDLKIKYIEYNAKIVNLAKDITKDHKINAFVTYSYIKVKSTVLMRV